MKRVYAQKLYRISLYFKRGIYFLWIIVPMILQADSPIYIDTVQPLSEGNIALEEKIKTQLSRETSPYRFLINPEKTKTQKEKISSKEYSFIAEIYYQTKKDLPPDLYIAVFHPDTHFLIDIVSEKSIYRLPKEIPIVLSEFQEKEEEIIARVIKKLSISLSLNPNKNLIRENISENFENKRISDLLSSRIKPQTKQEKSEDAFAYLKEQFDTATRTTQKVEDLPISVIVIGKKEVRDYNYRTLVEALKFKPGILVSEPGNGEIGHHFFQRGLLGNSYSKILLNGMPISPSVTFGMPINEMLYLKNAESIEVVYGPASSVYGADAFSGVVNIKTFPKKENNMRFETHVGEFGYLNHNFSATQKVDLAGDSLVLSVYGLKSNRRDQNIKNGYSDTYNAEKYYQRNGQFGDRVNYFSELPSTNSSYGSVIGFKTFSFYFDHMKRSEQSSLGQQSSFYNYNNSGTIWSDAITRFAAKNSVELGKISFNTNLSYNQYRLDPISNYNLKFEKSPLYKFMGSDDILFEQTGIFKPIKQLEVLLGFSYQYSGVFPKTNDLKLPFNPNFYEPFSEKKPPPDPDFGYFGYSPKRFQNTAGFFQISYSIENTSIIAGARSDTHTLYGRADTPRIAIIQKLSNLTSIRTSYTEGFRGAPVYLSTNSIAIGSAKEGVTYLSVPNENLKPEKLRSYEIGLRHLLTRSISIETIFFHNYVENKFNTQKVTRDPILYPNSTQTKVDTFGNVGKSNLNGIDIVLTFSEIHRPTHLNLQISNSFGKGSEVLAPEFDPDKSELESAILEFLDKKRNKIDNYRTVPNRMSKFRVSMKFFEAWFLALDCINTDGWYSRNILSKRQYDIAEFNRTYDPYFQKNKVEGNTIFDFNTYYEFLKYFRIMGKVTNLTNRVFSGQGAYDSSQNLDFNPQYRRNYYIGLEVNHSW